VAGRYSFDDCHIDLAALCARTGARLLHAEAVGLSRAGRLVLMRGQPPLAYDLLSLDVGSAPHLGAIAGAAEHAVPVKPIADFGKRWLAFVDRARGPTKIVVIGGGAGGVELALAIDHRLPEASVALATRDDVLAGHARAAQKKMRAILARRGIRVVENDAAVGVETDGARLASGERLAADAVFVVTEATAPHWLTYTGLTLDARGFVALAATLRSATRASSPPATAPRS